MKKLLLASFCAMGNLVHSQSTPMAFLDWTTTAGTQNAFYKNIVKVDGSKNVYVAGATVTSNGTTDIIITKTSSAGALLWTQQINGSANVNDFATELVVDASNNVYVTGAITNDTSALHYTDVVVIKLNSSGVLQFQSTYNGSAGLHDVGSDIKVDGTGNVFVTGGSYNSSGNTDMITLGYNSSGTLSWSSVYAYSYGGNDAGARLTLGSGLVTVAGAVQTGSADYRGAVVTYTKTTGAQQSFTTTTATGSGIDQINCAETDQNGYIYIGGAKQVTGHGYDGWLMKLTSTLGIVFDHVYNGASNLDDFIEGVDFDNSANAYVTGITTTSTHGTDFLTMKCNTTTGDTVWTKTYDSPKHGNDGGADIQLDASTNIYVTGYASSDINGLDYFTMKYANTGGNPIWSIQTDGSLGDDKAVALALDTNNNVIVTGSSKLANGGFQYLTAKYVQRDVIIPTDYNTETPSERYWYYQNMGQLRNTGDSLVPEILYMTDNTAPNMFIKKNGMSFVFAHVDSVAATNDTLQRIDLTHKGSSNSTKAYPLETQKFFISYFNGTGRDFPEVKANRKVVTPNLYPNIDLLYSSNENGIKYYYIVKPGGNPANIQIEFDGATSYSLNATTNSLSLNTNIGNVIFDRPTAYQLTTTNTTVAVTGWTPDWTVNGGSNKYKFNLGSYTSSLTLIIEVDQGNALYSPLTNGNLVWNTMQGGNQDDHNIDLKLDRSGNIYTMAFTRSSSWYKANTFVTVNPTNSQEACQFSKYSVTGTRQAQVYVGSNTTTRGVALTITNDSNVVIVGSGHGSNLSAPLNGNPAGAYNSTTGNSFIMKFDSTLTKVRWRTFYNGIIGDVDSKNNGDIYLSALSYTANGYVLNETGALNVSTASETYNAMVSKFNKNGVPQWSSFVQQYLFGTPHIKVDTTTNNFYVYGKGNGSSSNHFYNNYGTYLKSMTVGGSAFVKKFNASDSCVVSTSYAGTGSTTFNDATILANGDLCLVGNSSSTDTANLVYDPHDGSYISKKFTGAKGLIVKFSPNFTRKWATLYGDSAYGTSLNAATTDNLHSNLLVAGYTESMPNQGFVGCYYKTSDHSGDAAFISFDSGNHVTWSTSMGSNGWYEEGITALAYNSKNSNLDFAGGSAANAGYPYENYTTPQAYWQPLNDGLGFEDGVVGRFNVVMITGINEVKTSISQVNDVVVYPNPSSGNTNLMFLQNLVGETTITIYNSIGQALTSKNLHNIEANTPLNFNTTGLAEGVYFFNIKNGDSVKSVKFINFK